VESRKIGEFPATMQGLEVIGSVLSQVTRKVISQSRLYRDPFSCFPWVGGVELRRGGGWGKPLGEGIPVNTKKMNQVLRNS
jgi:hypothetical protein